MCVQFVEFQTWKMRMSTTTSVAVKNSIESPIAYEERLVASLPDETTKYVLRGYRPHNEATFNAARYDATSDCSWIRFHTRSVAPAAESKKDLGEASVTGATENLSDVVQPWWSAWRSGIVSPQRPCPSRLWLLLDEEWREDLAGS